MRAVRVHARSGLPSLRYEEAPEPVLGAGDALVRVHAVALTPTELTWNSTFTRRDGTERLPVIPGFDVSGSVERLGGDPAGLRVGDEVFGLLDFWRDGAAAEWVAVRAADLARKPRSLDHVRAAALPLSGLTAFQALFEHAKVGRGSRVLVHGASGGVGSLSVQLAHETGAHVIASASARHAEFLRGLGADEVIDRSRERFEERAGEVDLVLDTVGGETLERSWGLLRRGGSLVTIVGDVSEERARAAGIRAVSMLVHPDRAGLEEIARLVDAGRLGPVVERVLPLSEARAAFEAGAAGHNRGKTVLQVVGAAGARGGSAPPTKRV